MFFFKYYFHLVGLVWRHQRKVRLVQESVNSGKHVNGCLRGWGGFWRVLEGFGGFWRVLEGLGKVLEGFGEFWRVLEGLGKVLEGFGGFWRVLEGFGGFWKGFVLKRFWKGFGKVLEIKKKKLKILTKNWNFV